MQRICLSCRLRFEAVISPAYCQTMVRYNAWQNQSLYREADLLTDAQRRQDCGVFFGSVQRTLCHILTADHIWMSRFDGWDMPEARGDKSPDWVVDWDALKALRITSDAQLRGWADRLVQSDIDGDLTWWSGLEQREETAPVWGLVSHMFNHQTHHRGQVQGMLTGFGMSPDETDLGFMPNTDEIK
ncbi:MAG: DinB family protein [Paracoccaceae bacterium]